jgi:hypothetical protein
MVVQRRKAVGESSAQFLLLLDVSVLRLNVY